VNIGENTKLNLGICRRSLSYIEFDRFLVAGYDSLRYDFAHTDTISDEGGLLMGRNGNSTHYAAVNRSEVPQGRKGKHRKAVADILADLPKLNAQQAIKIPLSSLNGEKMQNLRSALNRVTREKNIPVVTSSDEKFLYVWRAAPPKNNQAAE
jgi:hypothetical protein